MRRIQTRLKTTTEPSETTIIQTTEPDINQVAEQDDYENIVSDEYQKSGISSFVEKSVDATSYELPDVKDLIETTKVVEEKIEPCFMHEYLCIASMFLFFILIIMILCSFRNKKNRKKKENELDDTTFLV